MIKQQTAEETRLYEVVSHRVEVQLGEDAWRRNGQGLTYAERRDQTRRFAKTPLAAGVRQGDRAALLTDPRQDVPFVPDDSMPCPSFSVAKVDGRCYRNTPTKWATDFMPIQYSIAMDQQC